MLRTKRTKGRIEISVVDPVHCRINKPNALLPCLQYEKEYWRQGRTHRSRHTYQARLVDKDGYFLTGFLPRARKYLENIGYNVLIKESDFKVNLKKPLLPGIKPRKDQLLAIELAKQKQRGVFHFPTGSGKTVVAGLLISSLPKKSKSLFLCHTIDLVNQTVGQFSKWGFDVGHIGGSKTIDANLKKHRVWVSTIQSFCRINPSAYSSLLDCVIVDECHHVSDFEGMYGAVLQYMLSPIRIGLTATLPEKKESQLALEGLIGPVISTLSVEAAIDINIIAKPVISLVQVPYEKEEVYGTYRSQYLNCIIRGRTRNRLILEEAKKFSDRGMTTLIMVRELEHGENLLKIAKILGLDVIFVHGSTDDEVRRLIKGNLNKKRAKCVIASAIWKEGIDIPSLDHVINAFGGRGRIPTVQVPGRGLRTDAGKKDTVVVTDFLDRQSHLAVHTIARLCAYKEMGWEFK